MQPQMEQASGTTFFFIFAAFAGFLSIIIYGLRTGRLPARGGGTIERRKSPRLFIFALSAFAFAAAMMVFLALVALKRGVLW